VSRYILSRLPSAGGHLVTGSEVLPTIIIISYTAMEMLPRSRFDCSAASGEIIGHDEMH
jgi:hypothetical protein